MADIEASIPHASRTASDRVPARGDAGAVSPGALVLVTGASGYIGGRLVGELLEAGYRVRCLVRTPAKLSGAPWIDRVEVVQGDVHGDLTDALDGVDALHYLVHTIGGSSDWIEQDRAAAENVRDQATRAGLRRIVYLGGLGDADAEQLSPHLASRHEVGRVLADGAVPVTELRAAVIIGSGSASFEMLRYLVEVLPVMVTPKWVETRCQPIAVRDVLRYLVGVLDQPSAANRIFEVGGPDVLSYREMMHGYAEEAGLRRRRLIPVPVLTPSLSSHWVGLVTPLPRSLARPLVDSLVNEVIVHDDSITRLLPGRLLSYRQAVAAALGRIRSDMVATSWAGAELGGRHPADPMPTDPAWAGGTVLTDERERHVDAPAAQVYRTVLAIGGDTGWYSGEWLWTIRGLMDKLVGGVGMRRGRRSPSDLRVGDPLDFWRVEALEPDRLVRLHAEMKLPGQAWLEWQLIPDDLDPDGVVRTCTIRQLARYHPRGLVGRAYWLAVAPFHRFVFPDMVEGIAGDAERRQRELIAPGAPAADLVAPGA